ncbi:NAD-dependent epimerase/dehydratase family protein [Acaryochloris sp. IP29b_bin.137]|uniref:NAD-dependent epimerase/dehydratase family protein n=1 Tax=Acaryochloris sp. IP29b_bin.137 TaxID=2969217 RepID=UPI002607FD52|nr:NAD-dependent epimerase/dehydratase family protein [Acaryochloris sp. IP29b_bin.137]
MNKILITGAENFLGYHIIKLLNKRNIRPRVLVSQNISEGDLDQKFGFKNLQVGEIYRGSIEDLQLLQKVCEGIDTVFHMEFEISLGSGPEAEKQMHKVNVEGTRNMLKAATKAKVKRFVFNSSALTVGLNYEPQPLDEMADWDNFKIDLPYALSRRTAELEALTAEEGPDRPIVVAVNPSLVMGPEDFIGAPANNLLGLLGRLHGKIGLSIPGGGGILDVRDYAEGAIRAAERGRHGQRYLLCGENILPEQLIKLVATITGFQPPSRFIQIPSWVVFPVVTILEQFTPLSRSMLALWNRYSWYDTKLAQHDLGWEPRPLNDTITDSIRWMKEKEAN